MNRLSDFNDYSIFPREKTAQRRAVLWLQRRIQKAFNHLHSSRPPGLFARLFMGNPKVDCMLRIFDHLGIAAVDMIYAYAHMESTARLHFIKEEGLGTRYDWVLRTVAPMQIDAMKHALSEERKRDDSNRLEDVYWYSQCIINRWSDVHSVGNSRTNPIDTWFIANHQAVLWDYFDNRCAKCGSRPPKFRDRTIDHAFIPFSRGGTFVMRDKATGTWTVNAIPLCRSCNSTKGGRPIENFFASEELRRISELLRDYPLERRAAAFAQMQI